MVSKTEQLDLFLKTTALAERLLEIARRMPKDGPAGLDRKIIELAAEIIAKDTGTESSENGLS